MLRTHNCGELRISDIGKEVTLCGWVQRNRELGGMSFIDLRDRWGLTQLAFSEKVNPEMLTMSGGVGREYVLKITGLVTERSNKNLKIPTGEIEINVSAFEVLNASKIPPFTIEEETDGGDELRMQFRYLDLRRENVRNNIILRHTMAREVRNFLSDLDFIEVETPVLIKSTPEGARDFVVPSRMNPGQFYALPQSPQTFKQLLMVSGFDRYFQIVKCFRDEDLRADRQPEFTQIDCEMSFVEREDILQNFEALIKHLMLKIKGVNLGTVPRLDYADAIEFYGSDKPDTRFGMKFNYLEDIAKGKGFKIFDDAESIIAINIQGAAGYTRKQLDELTEFVRKPQVGAKGMIYCRREADGSLKSSVDKFYDADSLKLWAEKCGTQAGDLILVLSGDKSETQKQMNLLRLEMGSRMGLRPSNQFSVLWVTDFPLLEWDEESKRFHAMHHPFTSPLPEDLSMMETDPGKVRANAYDMVINGVEVGGGSIRIHDRRLQEKMFDLLGFSPEEAKAQFGFLMNAFEYGAPPHGGIAFGFDRLCSVFGGSESIRDYIPFPKNNMGRDTMIDAPAEISAVQRKELGL